MIVIGNKNVSRETFLAINALILRFASGKNELKFAKALL